MLEIIEKAIERSVARVVARAEPAARRSRLVENVSTCAWRLDLPHRAQARARVAGDWLVVEAEPSASRSELPASAQCIGNALKRNARLPSGLKYVLQPEGCALGLSAELLLTEADGGDPARIEGWLSAITRALAAELAGGAGAPKCQRSGAPAIDVRTLSAEAGWPCIDRPSGVVEIELAHAHRFADVSTDREGVLLSFEVAGAGVAEVARDCADAVGVFLLSATAGVRLVRAVARTLHERYAHRFEVLLDRAPTAEDVGHACAALSAAAEVSERESEALASDPLLAGHYLSLRGHRDPGALAHPCH